MALSNTDSQKYVLGLPLEFLVNLGVKLPATVWNSLMINVQGTSLVPYRPILIRDLVVMNEAKLLKFRGVGKRILNDIKDALSQLHLSLGMTIPWPTPTPEERFDVAVRFHLLPPKGVDADPRIPYFRSERDQQEIRIFIRPPRNGDLVINNLRDALDASALHDVEVIGRF